MSPSSPAERPAVRRAATLAATAAAATAAAVVAPAMSAPAGAHPGGYFGLTDAEYNYCVQSLATVGKCVDTRVAANQAAIDEGDHFSRLRDGSKSNAFKHAWWTMLTTYYTEDREFAWDIVVLHEQGHSDWATEKNHQMDLHNDRVGYHLAAPMADGDLTFPEYATLEQITVSKANSAIADADGVHTDYTRLIYIC